MLDIKNIVTEMKNAFGSRALVAHACNLGYSGGRDQEDLGPKSAPGN
jgi:hypothetical protein